jgi:hypothetical protein
MLSVGMITVVVDEYDDTIGHYVNDLGFTLIEDTVLTPEKRWVVVSPGSSGAYLLLANATGDTLKLLVLQCWGRFLLLTYCSRNPT